MTARIRQRLTATKRQTDDHDVRIRAVADELAEKTFPIDVHSTGEEIEYARARRRELAARIRKSLRDWIRR